ncbi:hypothetical protein [Deinococcus sp. QL22]|uniref:hypothetical protein n=1 Tax=Deinococcus sp. QL22 TaxID=2939437 RepID=UPI002017F51F|nr:hypothetical protein [Deinococcus sp. QL22]UQN05403.1 hypothetical protein M1R55_11010 [Deinococcus sp. QL22]
MTLRRRWPVLALVLFTFAPLISVLLASSMASARGCILSSAGVRPCLILGWDAGSLLNTMALLSWFSLATLPLGFLIGCAWLIIGWMKRQKQKSANDPAQ